MLQWLPQADSYAIEAQRIEVSFYSLSCILTRCCIHNQVYSPATLCLWFPSRAALKLCFINSCTVVPTHSCAMNNSCSQTERREPKINTNANRAASWPQALCICLCFCLFLPHSVSFCRVYVCVCVLVLRTVSLTLVLRKPNVVYHYIQRDHISLKTNESFFSLLLCDCRWMLSFSSSSCCLAAR